MSTAPEGLTPPGHCLVPLWLLWPAPSPSLGCGFAGREEPREHGDAASVRRAPCCNRAQRGDVVHVLRVLSDRELLTGRYAAGFHRPNTTP